MSGAAAGINAYFTYSVVGFMSTGMVRGLGGAEKRSSS
jgi:hypothetical protein